MMCDISDYYKKNPQKLDEELELPFLLFRIKESRLIARVSNIDLTGGEPFLKEGLGDFIIGIFSMPQIKLVDINTNGFCTDKIIAVTRQILEKIPKNKYFSLSVSIDGIGPVHDKIRGVSGAFLNVDRTVGELTKLRAKYANFKIRSNAVIQHDNIDSIAAIKKYWDQHAIEGAFSVIQNPFYTRYEQGCRDNYFSPDDVRKIKEAMPKSKGMNYYLENGFKRPLHCFAGYAALFIDQFGDVYPCNFLGRNESFVMGNIRDSTLDSIWVSSKAREIRDKIKKCAYTSCWNGCEVDQTMIQFEGIDKILKVLSLGCLSYYRLRGLRGFK